MKKLCVLMGACLLSACGNDDGKTPAVATAKPAAEPSFIDASASTGLDFKHFNGATGEYYLPEIMGSGVALLDYDGDGDLDVFFVQGGLVDADKTMADATFPLADGVSHGSRLYRNDLKPGGKLAFVDVTAEARVGVVFDGMGAAVGDYDNDGAPDLLVTGVGRAVLYRNLGNGHFEDVSARLGIEDDQLSTSAAFVDYDRDGWLDLFITHYVHGTTVERKKCRNPAAELDYCGPQAFPPSIARLYHSEGGQHFKDVTQASGIGAHAGPGLGVAISDFNRDHWPDIYVANDGAASFLWMNHGDGTFTEEGLTMGMAYSLDGKAQAGMGIAIGDVDNDGQEDVLKTNLQREGANLYRRGAGDAYTDAAGQSNVLGATVGHTGFGVCFADFDNDGWLDAFVTNGAVTAMESQRGEPYPFRQLNVLLHNRQGTFAQVKSDTGLLAERMVGRGVATGDLDRDGDIDMVVANNNGPARLWLNQAREQYPDLSHWLRVRLHSKQGGRVGSQAVVHLEVDGQKAQMRRVDASGSYLSASDPVAHFGLGRDTRVKSLVVEWADGSRSEQVVEAVDREMSIEQP